MERIIEETADGGKTLYVPSLDEHYHSVKGVFAEAMHIFISTGLRHSAVSSPSVLEVGFGTGLNAFLTMQEAEQTERDITYTALELYPLEWSLIEQLDYTRGSSPEMTALYRTMHSAPWGQPSSITPHFSLLKKQCDLTIPAQWLEPGRYDVIYFDAFAPEKQPEMWTPQVFASMYDALADGGILVTYCAKGVVRRTMQAAGFTVERLPGPPGGKREILRATK